jgi:hypothetical protein
MPRNRKEYDALCCGSDRLEWCGSAEGIYDVGRRMEPSAKSLSRALVLWLPVILTGLMGGCTSGTHSTASRSPKPRSLRITSRPLESHPPNYLAPLTCWDTVSCCVERNPFTALESCGADPMRVAEILKALAEVYATLESTPTTEAAQTEGGTEAAQTGDQAEAAGRVPGWKRKCITMYVKCQNQGWVGNCYDCIRRCEGQHEWPEDMCYDPRKRN